jgi:hypothetical protein
MSVFCQQLAPQLHMPVFHLSQLAVDVRAAGVALRLGQLAVEEGRIGLVFQVMQPVVGGRLR